MDILVVDHHVLLREGLASLLNSEPGLSVIGEIGSAAEMVEKANALKPDMVLVSVDEPYSEELSAIGTIHSHYPYIKLVVLYTEESDGLLFSSIRSGVKGFVPKNTPISKLVVALKAVEVGEAAFPRHLISKIIDELVRLGNTSDPNTGARTLTAREREVLKHLADGAGNRQIAARLVIAENTVRVHVHNILEKLGFKNRLEAGEFARRHGLIPFPEDSPHQRNKP